MAEYKFIVNTENVNSYGYRILTAGIDVTQYERNPVVLFMHDRGEYKPTGDEVIGRARLAKENNELIAYITFDSDNEFASKIEAKVKGDFIRMCSMWADPIETTGDPKLSLPGQKYETVIKCKLIEISIVDIGGNDDALRLSGGNPNHKLKLLNNQNTMSELKVIALALGKDANSSEASVLEAVSELKLSLSKEKEKTQERKGKYDAIQLKQSTELVEKAVKLGLIPEALKDGQIKLFETDYDGQYEKLSSLIKEKESSVDKDHKIDTIKGVISLSGGGNTPGASEESFDYLQKKNPGKLSKIRTEQPDVYQKLCKAYGEGVRYTGQ